MELEPDEAVQQLISRGPEMFIKLEDELRVDGIFISGMVPTRSKQGQLLIDLKCKIWVDDIFW